jgi:hypothetical protein
MFTFLCSVLIPAVLCGSVRLSIDADGEDSSSGGAGFPESFALVEGGRSIQYKVALWPRPASTTWVFMNVSRTGGAQGRRQRLAVLPDFLSFSPEAWDQQVHHMHCLK